MNPSQVSPIVLDCGSLNCKAGFADISKRAPDFIFKTSEPFDHEGPIVGGDVISEERAVPIQDGRVEDWDSMETLWEYTFKEKMKVDPSEHSVLLSEPDFSRREAREKPLQVFFEKFRVPAFHLGSQGLLSLYSVGLSSGLVLHSGHGQSYLMSARDGHRPRYGQVPLRCTGRRLTQYAQELITASLRERQNPDLKTLDFKTAEKFKEDQGYLRNHLQDDNIPSRIVSLDCDKKEYSVDASSIGAKLGEALMNPSLIGISSMGLAEAVKETIVLSDDEDFMDEVYLENIVLSGGNTLFRGLQERLTAEVDKVKFLPFMTVNVKAAPYRLYSNWVGGSVIASLTTFDPCWITKQEFEEHGSNIFLRKCLPY